jgi:hypothetical protein
MNENQNLTTINRASGAAIGFVLAILIFFVLGVIVKISVRAPAIDADRDATIAKALFEIRTNEIASLGNAGWIDKQRGVVRLPINTAMKIAASEWKNPAQARADLISRVNKANAPLPKQPAKPNPFE